MSRPARLTPSRQPAPGVHRLGDAVVNFYALEEPDGLVLVDAGLPGHLGQFDHWLAASGHAREDVRAVPLTHGHPDHTGLAHALQRDGAEIWVHEADAPILRRGPRSALRLAPSERSPLPYLLRRPAGLGTPLHLARRGAFTARAVREPRTFDASGPLPGVPGAPRAVPLPGHTPGSTAYLFAERGLLFTGDALVTHDGLTGRRGPTLVCRGFTHDSEAAFAALDRLEALEAATGAGPLLLLPGHGDPFPDGPCAAVAQARRVGRP
ncbi:MBL fold metallo-hydrolase [Streptomyces triticirhizae]|uniref:MBL fold metallo-hydrolase n=1 Tax=Streptomyces triticirhizae TaxID=2483353 RepID=A0A3M2M0J1_9ACTN|nr:MBL fold metallo-hydrolase [Streptomyces triticirhizae]RMI42383.1 MBL fold metallo-hydrolase [Streptomyces triticirhizae]